VGNISWHVHYRQGIQDHVVGFETPEAATEAACRMLDHGDDVSGIGPGSLIDTLGREEIAHIYARWARARYH
jgi:hypothetical protein